MKTRYEWAVIGAGPAGMAALGKLIDNGIDPSTNGLMRTIPSRSLARHTPPLL